MATSGSITLGQVAEHTAVLAVACSRGERAGRYRLEMLIARHGADFGLLGVVINPRVRRRTTAPMT